MVVHPSFPAKTVPEFIAYAKANPGKINMASAGNGTPAILPASCSRCWPASTWSTCLIAVTGLHLPTCSADRWRCQFPLISLVHRIHQSRQAARTGVTTAMRSEALPDLPTVGDFVPGYEASAWFGVGAPKGTPAEIIDRLNKEINAGLADPKLKARLADLGDTPSRSRPPSSASSSPTKPRNGAR